LRTCRLDVRPSDGAASRYRIESYRAIVDGSRRHRRRLTGVPVSRVGLDAVGYLIDRLDRRKTLVTSRRLFVWNTAASSGILVS